MLKIYFHRRFSGFIAASCAVLVVSGSIGLMRAADTFPMVVQSVGWLIIAALTWGTIVGLRQLWRPPLMYSVDRRGVMIYYNAERICFAGNGVFLPWTAIAGMALEKRQSVGATRNRVYTWVIACTLQSKAGFPVPHHSVAYSPKDGDQVVCLDAFTGTVSKQAMLDQLRSFWQKAQDVKARPAPPL